MEELDWLEFDVFSGYPNLFQAVFMRRGGISQGKFSSLNLSDEVGDNLNHVVKNREIVHKVCGTELIFMKQRHGVEVVEITSKNKLSGHVCDGLYTKEKKLALVVTHADCQAAIFYDPQKEIIGALHVGWRGLVKGAYASFLQTLKEREQCDPQDLLVAISPSLGPTHAEFLNYKEEFPPEFEDFMVKKNYFDLKEIARFQLTKAGVLEKNIEISPLCTYENSKDFFSHRRDKETGRNGTLIAMR